MYSATDAVLPKVEHAGDISILTFTGSGNAVTREVGHLFGSHAPQHLLLDFRNVTYISGHGLGTLVALHRQMRDAGVRLMLFNLMPEVYEVFAITGLDQLFQIGR